MNNLYNISKLYSLNQYMQTGDYMLIMDCMDFFANKA